jgi:hypothetical protein
VAFTFSLPLNYIYTCLLFPLTAINLTMLFVSTYIDLLDHHERTFSDRVDSLAIVAGWAVTGVVVGIEVLGLGQRGGHKIGGVHEMKDCYVAMFLSQVVIFSTLLLSYLYLQS